VTRIDCLSNLHFIAAVIITETLEYWYFDLFNLINGSYCTLVIVSDSDSQVGNGIGQGLGLGLG
jgi:hypothetical protein